MHPPSAYRKTQVMTIRRLLVLSAAALSASTIAGHAGPCSNEIERMQARVDARVEIAAGAGPSARESSGALLHRQPTPGSIAAAETGLGEIPPEAVKAVREAMARAREADQAGNLAACEQALAEVQRSIGP
jgi:hypothetical protein